MTSGGQVIVGMAVSRTMTRCTQLLLLPAVSVAVQVTKFVPSEKVTGALLVSKATAQLSLVDGVPRVTFVALQRELAETMTSAGQVITGFWVSVTVTVKVQRLVLPLASVAVLVTVVTPTGNVLPFVGLLTRLVTAQLSVAVTVKLTLLRLHRPGSAGKVRFVGQVITGFWLSVKKQVRVTLVVTGTPQTLKPVTVRVSVKPQTFVVTR